MVFSTYLQLSNGHYQWAAEDLDVTRTNKANAEPVANIMPAVKALATAEQIEKWRRGTERATILPPLSDDNERQAKTKRIIPNNACRM